MLIRKDIATAMFRKRPAEKELPSIEQKGTEEEQSALGQDSGLSRA